MSFLLKKGDSLPTSDDLSTKDINPINPERDIPKLDVFKDIESEDDEIGDQAAGGTYTQTTGNVRVSDSKVKCLFSPQLIFIFCQWKCSRERHAALHNVVDIFIFC